MRAVSRIEMGAEVLREVPLLLAPNKIKHPFGRVAALYDTEPVARRRILLELVVRGISLQLGLACPMVQGAVSVTNGDGWFAGPIF